MAVEHPDAASKSVALVLEGGSYRGQFTAGVIDVLLEHGIETAAAYGASAGALNGLNYKSRQIGRANRVNLAFCDDSRYIGARSFAATGSFIGYDFLLNEIQLRLDPFDDQAFQANPMRLFAVVTDIVFGTPAYLEVASTQRDLDVVRASTSLPLMAPPVEIDGHFYLDGGIADSVPVERALEVDGFDRALVVLTRERAYRKEPYELMSAARARLRAYPYLLDGLATRHERYNAQRERIWDYERAGRALVIAPERPVEVGHIERDAEKLLDLYLQGRRAAERDLESIGAFVAR
ncbi:Patatin [Coriobacterium glomerans PW2]|uniref:Patatin n=1 Tax=Coriobacterium glomerans (strain ATCC 49209 / DSM 20642 / JCM 10262 / PW2) TaxID=700015 RepID=F2NAS3_CORGP|nr:patatin family protein [Coriobacterium glomerans]AEB07529.1 Patatin [Coriobacterium glomerans PW2]